jgi:hypothetical protein
MKNLPLWPFLAFRTIVESTSFVESVVDWGTNPPPATKTSFISYRCNHRSKRSLPLLSSYWGSAGLSAQSCESRNCMRDRLMDSGWSVVTFGNCAQRCGTGDWSLLPIYMQSCPRSLVTPTEPPCRLIIALAIGNPIPVPWTE